MTLRVGIYLPLLSTRTHAFGCTCIALVTPVVDSVVTSVVNGTTPGSYHPLAEEADTLMVGALVGLVCTSHIMLHLHESHCTMSVVQAAQD